MDGWLRGGGSQIPSLNPRGRELDLYLKHQNFMGENRKKNINIQQKHTTPNKNNIWKCYNRGRLKILCVIVVDFAT